ncbi:MAG: hypothetical protein K2L98_02055, partial [Bacilli bacterium]|nr:hypothetical protein [Bacilli bacterium]
MKNKTSFKDFLIKKIKNKLRLSYGFYATDRDDLAKAFKILSDYCLKHKVKTGDEIINSILEDYDATNNIVNLTTDVLPIQCVKLEGYD